jgi:hypothetical protein
MHAYIFRLTILTTVGSTLDGIHIESLSIHTYMHAYTHIYFIRQILITVGSTSVIHIESLSIHTCIYTHILHSTDTHHRWQHLGWYSHQVIVHTYMRIHTHTSFDRYSSPLVALRSFTSSHCPYIHAYTHILHSTDTHHR